MSISQNKIILASDLNPLPIANGGTGVRTLEDLKNILGIKNNTPDYFIAGVLPVSSSSYNYVLSNSTRHYVNLPYPVDLSNPWRITVINFGTCFTAKASTSTVGVTSALECGLSNNSNEYELNIYGGCTTAQNVITAADDWCLYPHIDEIWLFNNSTIIQSSGYRKGEFADTSTSFSGSSAVDGQIYNQIYYRGVNAASYKPGVCGLSMIFEKIY